MYKLRLHFSKTGRARFISHLDLMATMQRALLRAGVKLKYSEGFNPHPYLSVALPIKVGCESLCELADIGVTDHEYPAGLIGTITSALPEGIEIIEAYIPERKFSKIKWLEISGVLYYGRQKPDNISKRLSERFAVESIVISKRTKRGVTDIEIKPFIRDVEFKGDSEVTMTAKISAQEPSLNPDDLMESLNGTYCELKPNHTEMTRKEIYDENVKVFR